MKIINILLVVLLLTACGTTHQLKKAQRLINKAKAAGAKVTADTVFQDRKVIVPGKETTVTLPGKDILKDTIIYQDKIKIHVQRDTVKEFIHVECPPDTVTIRVPVAVNETIECPPKSNFWRTVALTLAGVIVAGVLARRLLAKI